MDDKKEMVIDDSLSITNKEGDFEILTKRPEGMEYADYKAYMRAQKRAIKKYLKGTVVHLAKLYPTPDVLRMLAEEEYSELAILLTKGHTYIKPKEDDASKE